MNESSLFGDEVQDYILDNDFEAELEHGTINGDGYADSISSDEHDC